MSVTGEVELIFEGPAALAERVRNKDLTPRELVELCLNRIDELNPRINAFRITMAEEALPLATWSRTIWSFASRCSSAFCVLPVASAMPMLSTATTTDANHGSVRVVPPPART